ncbi:hypothetical protein BDR04DRAFT_1162123 [Suillus decipiens]|nr:hypothetical protein BDR04DRAFT_1162123 [Suillus decipiens]
MNHRDEDAVTISACPCDLGGDISKDLVETSIYTPYRQIQSQPQDLPDDRKLPSHPFARFCFSQLLLITPEKLDLEELWKDVSQWNCMNKHVLLSENTMVLLAIVVLLFPLHGGYTFMLHTFKIAEDYPSKEHYDALVYSSLYLYPVPIICELLSRANLKRQVRERRGPSKVEVLINLAVTRTEELSFALSLGLMAMYGFPGVDRWMSFVGACVFGFLLDAFSGVCRL